MNLQTALRIGSRPRLAFAGAGGKSTALFRLAREILANHSLPNVSQPAVVILTATTHLALAQTTLADAWHVVQTPGDVEALFPNLNGAVLFTGPAGEGERIVGLDGDVLDRLYTLAEQSGFPLLLEADGSRRRPLKAPADHEPVIPDWVDEVVVVVGLSGLGRPLDTETVHRPELFASLASLTPGETITPEGLSRVLAHPQGGLKSIPPDAKKTLLLNQASTPERWAQAKRLAESLQQVYPRILIANLANSQEDGEVEAVYTRTAGVVLAAGGSSRFGRPKQLLDWHGQPLVRHVAQVGLSAGLNPLVVVTGAYQEAVHGALEGLPVQVVENPDWAAGQSTSLRAGIQVLPVEIGSAVFLLSDQPQTPERLISSLVDTHRRTQAPVVAPLVEGRRSNPVLFDQQTFPDLLALEGDTGGRGVFSKYRVHYVEWLDVRQALDIDTPADYLRLLEATGG